MLKLSGALITFVALVYLTEATDYCSPSICPPGESHIACGHSGKFGPKCPADASLLDLDRKLKDVLINTHNAKRNLIAGGRVGNHGAACRMATMQWDDELASLAALNVRQCEMQHDRCHNTDAFKYSGQNLAWMNFYEQPDYPSMLTKFVNMWYSEQADCKPNIVNKFPPSHKGPVIGHFTVMVADRNTRLGCAASTYSVPGKEYTILLIACNYATTNMVNFPIYKKCKKSAVDCTTGINQSYKNLCSPSESYNINVFP